MSGMRTELAGCRFGLLTALEPARVGAKAGWLCRCDCGATAAALTNRLRAGLTRSCGCMQYVGVAAAAKANRTHGMTNTKTFRAWAAMKNRCSSKSNRQFDDYGGRGISVCERWASSFENFLHDMGESPDGYQLDRFPDNDGNYEPGNCRCATPADNCRNKRTTRMLTLDGLTMCATDWANRLGVTRTALQRRIDVLGWTTERALTEGKRA